MSTISDALSKRPANSGEPTAASGSPPLPSDLDLPPAGPKVVYPVSSILRLSNGRRPPAQPPIGMVRRVPIPVPEQPAPTPRNWTAPVAALSAVCAGAILIGFLSVYFIEAARTSRTSQIASAAAPESSALAPVAAAPTPQPTAVATVQPTPAATPIVVRVEFAQAREAARPEAAPVVPKWQAEEPQAELPPPPPKPAAPAAAPAKVSPDQFHIEGIFWSESKPAALINGEIYEVGDSIEGGAVLKKVKRSSVILDVAGREMEIPL